jgi:predicted lipoprotein with Yx(FWY)xxD motif
MTQLWRNGRPRIRTSLRSSAIALVVGGLAMSLAFVSAAGAASTNKPKSLVISTTTNPKLGTLLISRTTLYSFKPSKVACGAKCLKVWPEVLLPKGVTKATAGTGVNAGLLGTVRRSHGRLQVTYFGQPLYWFFLDKHPGQVKGNVTDKWGKWNAVVIAAPATVPATSPTTTPTTKPAAGVTTPTSRTTTPPSRTTTPTSPSTTPPTTPPTSTPTTSPPATTTTTAPATTTTTAPGGGGVGF